VHDEVDVDLARVLPHVAGGVGADGRARLVGQLAPVGEPVGRAEELARVGARLCEEELDALIPARVGEVGE
jgi:hypothetical protein